MNCEVSNFQKATLEADAEGRPSVGLGTDFRLESKKVTGFALALNDQLFIFQSSYGEMGIIEATNLQGWKDIRKGKETAVKLTGNRASFSGIFHVQFLKLRSDFSANNRNFSEPLFYSNPSISAG